MTSITALLSMKRPALVSYSSILPTALSGLEDAAGVMGEWQHERSHPVCLHRCRGPFGADPRGHIAPVPPLQTWRTCSTSRRARLAFDVDTRQVSERFRAVLSTVLLLPDLPGQADGGAAARDVMAIKGMVDAAGAWRDGSVRAHNKGAQRSA